MNLRQQIIQEHIEKTATKFALDESKAFARFCHAIVTGDSLHAFAEADNVDGGQDKQIDIISIAQNDDEATIYIFQVKNTTSFASNSLIQMHNGLQWLFTKPRKELESLTNKKFKDKILEYRSVLDSLGPSNINIQAYFITNGVEGDISDEFKQELRSIEQDYNNNTFADFSISALGCDRLTEILRRLERHSRKKDVEIKIKYDANSPSVMKYYTDGLEAFVCSVPAKEIAAIVNDDKDGTIFDLNIRKFLGTRGAVNKGIYESCTNLESSYQFWFLNNGITVICDKYDLVPNPDNPHVKITNFQIVNGGQTATTLANAARDQKLAINTQVILRIYKTDDEALVDKIVLTTNNQNKITNRDLRANDKIQLDIEKGFKIYGYFYERKPRQYDAQDVDIQKIIPNEFMAQCYLAIVLHTPSDARRRKYRIWEDDLYARVFNLSAIESSLIVSLVTKQTMAWLKQSDLTISDDDVTRKIANNGLFHLARIATYLWRTTDSWKNENDLKTQLELLKQNPALLADFLATAFTQLKGLITGTDTFAKDIDNAFKSASLDKEISKSLHTNSQQSLLDVAS